VLKNLTNIFTLAGDYALYGRSYNLNVWGCVALMLLSAVCGAATDLAFDARGYFWQIVNCMFTAAYSLYMRGAMDRVAQHTSDGKKLGEFSMVGGLVGGSRVPCLLAALRWPTPAASWGLHHHR
jgi:GDP-mannose transporter